jgi:hypothetical protein
VTEKRTFTAFRISNDGFLNIANGLIFVEEVCVCVLLREGTEFLNVVVAQSVYG